MNCPFCSAKIENENVIFCNNCGKNIKQAPIPSANTAFASGVPNPTPVKPPKAKSSNTVTICICAVIAVALICGTAVGITAIKQNGEQATSQTVPTEAAATQAPTTTAAAPATTTRVYTEPTVSYSDPYLFPTHTTYLTYEILSRYTKDEIDLICNEMYARHGQIFKKEKNQRYFSAQSWYRGKYTSMDYVVTLFNKYEQKNLQTIADYRRYMGWS